VIGPAILIWSADFSIVRERERERETGAAVTLHQRIVAHTICPIKIAQNISPTPLPEEHL